MPAAVADAPSSYNSGSTSDTNPMIIAFVVLSVMIAVAVILVTVLLVVKVRNAKL
jgi:hypothetical protein